MSPPLGQDRRSRRDRRKEPRSSTDRRSLDLGAPPPSAWAHLFDVLFFRILGVAMIANEVVGRGQADWHIVVAGFGAFFMPDWLRGKSSPFVRAILTAWLQGRTGGVEDES